MSYRIASKFLALLLFVFFTNILMGQSVVDELEESALPTGGEGLPSLATETIERISESGAKRIFIITNNNASFDKGDFISLLIDNKLICRAIAAKLTNQVAGIKIIKIYSMNMWKELAPGVQVQILRGDDSYFKIQQKKQENEDGETIKEEEDLFKETSVNDDLELDENKNRAIKTDNILGISYGYIVGVDNNGSAASYRQPSLAWAYQIADNIWGEVSYGQNNIQDFPNPGLSTVYSNFTIRGKYTIAAPFYSFVQPYVGYQITWADSPAAGKKLDGEEDKGDAYYQQESQLVDDLEKKKPIFGLTILKRMVPGWFARVDLGTDVMSMGFCLEF